MTLQERINAPTPKFFKRVSRTGLVAAALSAAILALPVGLPAAAEQIFAHLSVAGITACAVSQTTVGGKENKSKTNGKFTRQR
jgi:hypothetical protein